LLILFPVGDQDIRFAKSHLRGQLEAAIGDYNTAIGLNPRYVLAYGNRGLARLLMNDPQKAQADFDICFELTPI
jgi:hypothetical protein